MDQVKTTPTAAPAPAGTATAPRESIRDTFMRRLERERGDTPPAAAPAARSAPAERTPQTPPAQAAEPAGEPVGDPVATDPATDPAGEPQAQQEGAEALDPDAEFDALPDSVKALIEKVQERERQTQIDYTRKTTKLAEAGRQLAQDSQVIRQTAQFVAGIIDAPVRQLENTDWATLQTQEPAEYQRRRKQYEDTVNARNGLMRQLAAMEQQHEQALERHRQEVAAVSREILKSKIDGWNNEKYATLRDFAVNEFGYTRQEMDANTDHRLVELMHEVYTARQAREKLKGVTRKGPQTKPQGANRPTIRNEAGQFQNARQNLQNQPGNRQAAREFFRSKLAAERKRNNG